MADNYLEKRYEEVFSGKTSPRRKQSAQSLNSLLLKNRSYRGYDESRIVTEKELIEIVEVNNKIPSARNQQVLRFKLVTGSTGAEKVLANIRLGGALPELRLPMKGSAPSAYIIICSTVPENKWVDMDLGISAQSMLLKSVEMGLNGILIGAFNKEMIMKEFDLTLEPLLIVALGKGAEKIQLLSIRPDDNHNYFRENGIHFVPKISTKNLII